MKCSSRVPITHSGRAAVALNGGVVRHYARRPENAHFMPDLDDMQLARSASERVRSLSSTRTTRRGAVYSRETLEAIVDLAERHGLVVLATKFTTRWRTTVQSSSPWRRCAATRCARLSGGLSKVYRACGYRVGWVSFSGVLDRSEAYRGALELLAALRLCGNVPGQWAVQTALGGYQSIRKLCSPGGRLYESRQAIIDGVERSRYLCCWFRRAARCTRSCSVDRRQPTQVR